MRLVEDAAPCEAIVAAPGMIYLQPCPGSHFIEELRRLWRGSVVSDGHFEFLEAPEPKVPMLVSRLLSGVVCGGDAAEFSYACPLSCVAL